MKGQHPGARFGEIDELGAVDGEVDRLAHFGLVERGGAVVEAQRDRAPVGVAVRRVLAAEGDDLSVLRESALQRRHRHDLAHVELVVDEPLGGQRVVLRGQENHPLDLRQRLEARLGAPVTRIQVEHFLLRGSLHQLVGTRPDRPAFGWIVEGEGHRILVFEDGLGPELFDDAVVAGQRRRPPARVWLVEHELYGQVVDRLGFFQEVDLGGVDHLVLVIAHGVERVGDVLGGERRAVAPLDALAQLDGQLGEVGVVLPRLGEPVLIFAGKHVEHDQGLGHGLECAAVPAIDRTARGSDVEVGEVRVLTVGTALHGDQGLVAWHRLQRCAGSRRSGWCCLRWSLSCRRFGRGLGRSRCCRRRGRRGGRWRAGAAGRCQRDPDAAQTKHGQQLTAGKTARLSWTRRRL